MLYPVPVPNIAAVLRCPAGNVAAYWPLIETCLVSLGVWSELVGTAALATIGVECPPFKPIKEYGGQGYLNNLYDKRTDLGNTAAADGDGALYAGRGFVQITGRNNYYHYGKLLGMDLLRDPDKALEPNAAAAIFASYFWEHGVHLAANERDWARVRRLVNGGLNGFGVMMRYVNGLEAERAKVHAVAAAAGSGN